MDKRLVYVGATVIVLLAVAYWYVNSPSIKVEILDASFQPEDMTSMVLITKRLFLEAENNAESIRDLLGEESDEYKETLANLEEAREHLDTLTGLYPFRVELHLEVRNNGNTAITLKDPEGELSLDGTEFQLDEGFSTHGMLAGETDTVVISFTAVNSEESVELYWVDSLTGEYSGSLRASVKMSKKTVQYGGSVTMVLE